ncbi:hypothetical protein OIU74_004135 [Salix koriyanagi]|uniref:Uncharacterized protein n=1 Tax=Salix koriyanagi TaxID=2511006 RepID=A0A9Q0UZK1_9ROSI|nr:hypothetical protein OIU74_004135 [Salix koriyanagi]
MRPWRPLQWCLGEEGERRGCHRGPKARPRCRGRGCVGEIGRRWTIGGESEREKRVRMSGPKRGSTVAGCERKRVKPWSRKIVEMRCSLWRKNGKGKMKRVGR